MTVGEQTFAFNDINGISVAIMNLANATGDEAFIDGARSLSCHVEVMNGKWFALISSEAFHEVFPGRNSAAYNDARREARVKTDEIFAQLCAERGLNEFGYPIVTPTPPPAVVPVQPPAPPTPVPAAKLPTTGGIGAAYAIIPSAPKGFTMQSASYSSSNPSVATVDAAGNVTLVGGGKATIVIRVVSQKVDKRGRVFTRTSTVTTTLHTEYAFFKINISPLCTDNFASSFPIKNKYINENLFIGQFRCLH